MSQITKDSNLGKNLASPPGGNKKEEDDDRGIAGFWWWAPAALAATVLTVAIVYFYLLMHRTHEHRTGMTVVRTQPVKLPAPVQQQHVAREKIESAYFFRIDGVDSQARVASFDFIMLTNDYTWALGSTTQVISKGAQIPDAEVASRVMSPKIRESLDAASDLIAVGLASQEGEQQAEEARALARAQTVSGWFKKVANPTSSLWTLTLGQYKKCKQQEDADTSFERPIILAGVRAKDEGVNLQEALANAIGGRDNLPSRECYSRFDMTQLR